MGLVPINIDNKGIAHPPHAPVSQSANGGVDFNPRYDCALTFTNGCPFQNCNKDTLDLKVGPNREYFDGSEIPGNTYPYSISPPLKRAKLHVTTSQFDITVTS